MRKLSWAARVAIAFCLAVSPVAAAQSREPGAAQAELGAIKASDARAPHANRVIQLRVEPIVVRPARATLRVQEPVRIALAAACGLVFMLLFFVLIAQACREHRKHVRRFGPLLSGDGE